MKTKHFRIMKVIMTFLMQKTGYKCINRIIILLFLSLVSVQNVSSQDLKFTDWEKETFLKQPPEKIIKIANIKPGMVIGEVGAGYGRITLHLAKNTGENGKVYANDINKNSLDSLSKRCLRAGLKNVEIVLGKENHPCFPIGELDVVIFVWTYHWIKNPVNFLKNLLPSLKPGAKIVLVEPDPVRGLGGADHGVSVERIKTEAEQAGFKLIKTYTDFPQDFIFVLQIGK